MEPQLGQAGGLKIVGRGSAEYHYEILLFWVPKNMQKGKAQHLSWVVNNLKYATVLSPPEKDLASYSGHSRRCNHHVGLGHARGQNPISLQGCWSYNHSSGLSLKGS